MNQMSASGKTGAEEHATRLTYVGHGTVLIEMDGLRLLVDPLLRRWIGPLVRRTPRPHPELLRNLDAVLITHLHIDHLDVPSLRLLDGDPVILIPDHGVDLLRRRGYRRTIGMVRGTETPIGPVSVTATYAFHSGRRRPASRAGDALGFVVRGSHSIYVAGDTGLFAGMAELAQDLDVACLPIDGWGPRLPKDHLSPLTAAKALALLRPRIAIPIHWGTYFVPGLRQLRGGGIELPPRDFVRYAEQFAPQVEVHLLEPGTWLELPTRRPASVPSRRQSR